MESFQTFELRELDRKCNIFGNLFVRAKKLGYSSKEFIEQIMTTKEYDDIYNLDDGYEWCDECFLLRLFENTKAFKKGRKKIDDFELWFMGYLYKYWTSTRKISKQKVYKKLPFEKFDKGFSFYHTQGWDFVINDTMKK